MDKRELIGWHKLGRVIIVIDAANLEKSAQALRMNVHYTRLKRFFSTHLDLKEIRFYTPIFSTREHEDFLMSLKRRGYHLITKPIKEIKDKSSKDKFRKANFDVEITFDVLDHLSNFDTLILFSGDSDFDYLIRKIRQRGKKVLVFSTRYHISKELIASCTRYFDIRKFKDAFLK